MVFIRFTVYLTYYRLPYIFFIVLVPHMLKKTQNTRNRKTLPKTCILSFFDHVTYKDAEIHGKNLMFVKLKDITRNVYFECFLNAFSTKKLKPRNNDTLYKEKINK